MTVFMTIKMKKDISFFAILIRVPGLLSNKVLDDMQYLGPSLSFPDQQLQMPNQAHVSCQPEPEQLKCYKFMCILDKQEREERH